MAKSSVPFNLNTISQLEGAVRTLAGRMLTGMHITLTPEEFIQTYIEPRHVSILLETRDLCGFIGSDSSSVNPGVDGAICKTVFVQAPPIILPAYIKSTIQPDAPPAVVARIAEFVQERIRLGRAFGAAIDALYWLNANCRDVNSFRVMFPALPALLATIDPNPESKTSKRAVRLASVSTFAPLPAITDEALKCMRDASALIQAASMLPADSELAVSPGTPRGTAIVTFAGYLVKHPHPFNEYSNAAFI